MELVVNWGQGSKSFGPTDTITVGRSQQCSIVLDHGSVSRTHLTISFADGQWKYTDSSSNGTFDNGQKNAGGSITKPMTLRVGSVDGPSLSLEPQIATPQPFPGQISTPQGTVAAKPVSQAGGAPLANEQTPSVQSQSTEAFTPNFAESSSDHGPLGSTPQTPTPPISTPPTPTPPTPTPPSAAPVRFDPPAAPGNVPPKTSSLFDPPSATPGVPGSPSIPAAGAQMPSPAPAAPTPAIPNPAIPNPAIPNPAMPNPQSFGTPAPAPMAPNPQQAPPGPPPAGPMGGAPVAGYGAAPLAAGNLGASSLPDHSPSLGSGIGAGTIQLDDRMLRLELDGKTGAFHPNQQVTVGRDPNNNLTSSNQLVSASHCRFTHDGTSWWIEDVGSSRGTYIDNRRVVKKQKIQGAFNVSLGDDDAGELMRVVTGGYHKRKENKAPLFLAGAALAAVAVIGIATLLLWPDTSGFEETIAAVEKSSQDEIAAAKADFAAQAAGANGNTPEQLQKARLATGLIYVIDSNEKIVGTGSGAVVSEEGHLLTNMHVALPGTYYERTGNEKLRGSEDGPFVVVGFTSIDGGTVDLFFKAEHVAPHPGHDAALLKIVEGVEIPKGTPAPGMDMLPEPLEFATSSTLRGGDQIAVIGYPGLARQDAETARVSVSINNFQSFTECRINTGWGCQQDYDQGLLNVAGETLEGGSSGGPIIRNGKVVGIQMGVLTDGGGTSGQDQGVPSDVILDGLPQLPRPTE